MVYEILFAAALIGAPATAVLGEEPTSETTVENTTEVVSEEVTSDIVISDENQTIPEVVEDFDFGDWVSETFNGQMILTILSLITAIGAVAKAMNASKDVITGAVHSLKQVDQHNEKTVSTSVDKQVGEKIVPLFEAYNNKIDGLLSSVELLCKLFIAGQDTSPSGKAYFADLTQSVGKTFNDSKEFVEKISADLKNNIEEAKKAEEEVSNKLQEIVDETSEETPVE